MTKPISPDEVVKLRETTIPPRVIEVFNARIAAAYDGHSATVLQSDIVRDIENSGYDRGEIFANHWLDVEPIYEQAGWRVSYDKPAFNETYEPSFSFTRRK